ncbi:MAG: hypothetical protein IPG04_12330 [Polyangiaceae bacterium]|nr:hypothetical protein [Polyangiaceae bacterium]
MTTPELLARWTVAFLLTQLVECALYTRCYGVRLPIAFGASAITHPIVVFAIWPLWGAAHGALARAWPGFWLGDTAYFVVYGVVAETFAIGVEAAYLVRFARLAWQPSARASLLVNGASAGVGLLSSWLTGWP